MGFRRISMNWMTRRRSLKNRSAARVSVESSRPKTWISGPVGAAGARFVDSILNGARPADLPAQEVPRVEFALSLWRAAELGIDVPPDVQTQADVVYP